MGIEWQILRPGIVSGRLMDSPLYFTSKFDVFYGWAKFFYNLSRIEQLYYRTVGEAFDPYITCPKTEYDTTDLQTLTPSLVEPDVRAGVEKLVEFAVEHEFEISF